jgi:KipI family sensor histidine kinase inhibitor
MVHYDPLRTSRAKLTQLLERMLRGLEGTSPKARHWRIPVCYDSACGLDLPEVASRTGLDPAEVIARHCSVVYHVYMIGFTPGYPYMGDLPAARTAPPRGSAHSAPAGRWRSRLP